MIQLNQNKKRKTQYKKMKIQFKIQDMNQKNSFQEGRVYFKVSLMEYLKLSFLL